MTPPKVSIVIPVYNGTDYLREAIDSALAQTYPSIEIIVVNDGSRDDDATEHIALSYGNKIRYFKKENGGVASALNRGIDEMTGDYFSWLSHDDLYYPNKIETQIQALSGLDRSITILYSDYAIFSDDPNVAHEIHLPSVLPEKFRYFITIVSSLHGCTLLIPQRAFALCGTFNEKLRTTQDYDLWFRLAETFRFEHIPAVLVKARHHPGQGSITLRDIAILELNSLHAGFAENLSRAELSSATGKSLSLAYAGIAGNFGRRRFYPAARHAAVLAIRSLRDEGLLNAIVTIVAIVYAALTFTTLIFTRFTNGLVITVRIALKDIKHKIINIFMRK